MYRDIEFHHVLGAFDGDIELTAEGLELLIEGIETAGMIGDQLIGRVDARAELGIGGLNFLAQAGYFGGEVLAGNLRGASAESEYHPARAEQGECVNSSERGMHTVPLFSDPILHGVFAQ
jgi:hypothetical protein